VKRSIPAVFTAAFFIAAGRPSFAELRSFNATSPVQNLLFKGRTPRVLVLYDGIDKEGNPGRQDALYLTNLLGHFTTHRDVESMEEYRAGQYQNYDATFVVIYQRQYAVPRAVLADVDQDTGTVCWIGNQAAQLQSAFGTLARRGIAFQRFTDQIKLNQVFYKGQVLVKGDPETNFYQITDRALARPMALISSSIAAVRRQFSRVPYVIKSAKFWLVADSPFSYSSENDRYLAFADLLHDILGVQHAEQHLAILRIEDINALSRPPDLAATLQVIRKHGIPFAFGFVPAYVNPHERVEMRLSDKPEVVDALHRYMRAGGAPVLHGFTHQYRGVTTDDYEFWDDLGDRPIRGDSESFVERRLEEAIKESMQVGIYPVTWETPHYAASPLDYRVMHRFFDTVFERRLVTNRLDSDQYFPYPVIDLYGQFVIPENLAYVPIDDQRIEPQLSNADAARVVRDGYASVFFHPFLSPDLLDRLIGGIQQRGYEFVDIRHFPNKVRSDGRLIQTAAGPATVNGHGRYLNERVIGARGWNREDRWSEVPANGLVKRQPALEAGETYVALRQDAPPPSVMGKLFEVAKGNLSGLHRRWETVFPARVTHDPVKTTILWNPRARGPEAVDQQSFFAAITSMGFDVEKVDPARLSDDALGAFALLVIPQASAKALPPEAVERVLNAVNGGITLVTDGDSAISRGLGLRLGEPIRVENLLDHLFVSQDTHWADRPRVPYVAEPEAEKLTVYYSDKEEDRPLVVGGTQGVGHYLYFAPLFDEITGQGYGRFPDLPQILINEFRFNPLLRGRAAEAYFDPGYRQAVSIEVLAKMWRRYGIRAVHAAAWTFYDKYVYDYERLVRVAHQNGILVYAWFEWPEVSQRFWDHHPEWREKTALGTDARVDWRFLMNLQNPQCLKAVLADAQHLLRQYDWDGVDIGELTFDSLGGPESPGMFTPFNANAREEFQKLHGFDPKDLFKPSSPHFWKTSDADLQTFYSYRQDVNARLMKTFLEALDTQRKKEGRPWEIIVTLLDVLQHPDLGDYLGIDFNRTLALLKQYRATLQVEDPASDWSLPPDRYVTMGKKYAAAGMNEPYMIDINLLPVHPPEQRGFATAKPTGVELLQLWHAASSQTPRVCFYSEASVMEQDWEILPYAMAGHATLRKEGDNWIIKTPRTAILELGRGPRRFELDGQPWLCAEKGDVWIPPGEHTLKVTGAKHSLIDTAELETRLLSITGELLGSQRIKRGMEIEYDSPSRCALLFNKQPYKMHLDGDAVKLPVTRGDEGYTVLAPPGHHRLQVVSESVGLYLLEFTSVVTASLIVLFGLASTGLLAFLFLFVTLHRRTAKLRKFFGLKRKKADEDD
jgi:uncharacterized protein YdaL